ncbi:MAG: hypothetical protein H0U67_11070 [Gemmatimonadetes bacterium]|nr:hypothetical protein [Gemmatimonadota bacterium]
MRNSLWVACLAAVIAAPFAAGEAVGQVGRDTVLVYDREVFRYDRGGRPDPFRSLLTNEDLGIRTEDLTLLGVIFHPDPSQSVAVLARRGVDRRLRARVGERLGSVRVVGINQRSIDVVVEEFGLARRERLEISPSQERPAQ